jgi:hypothetical protein
MKRSIGGRSEKEAKPAAQEQKANLALRHLPMTRSTRRCILLDTAPAHETVMTPVRPRTAAMRWRWRKLDGPIEGLAEGFRAPGLQAKLDVLERRKGELTEQTGRPGAAAAAAASQPGRALSPEGRPFAIELTGAIARMVALAQGGAGGDPALFACSVKVVAGARNHLKLLFNAAA